MVAGGNFTPCASNEVIGVRATGGTRASGWGIRDGGIVPPNTTRPLGIVGNPIPSVFLQALIIAYFITYGVMDPTTAPFAPPRIVAYAVQPTQ